MEKTALTIRIGKNTLSFSTQHTAVIDYEPYIVKSGVSMAANLREALKTTARAADRLALTQVMIDSKPLIVPIDEYKADDAETLYRHSFPLSGTESVEHNVLPDLNAVVLFAINKDLKLVITDRFEEPRFIHVMAPVWRYLHQRSYTGHRAKLYAYFHDKQLDICSFKQNRFKFSNAFETTRAHDALYFMLYVWKQLGLEPEHDELHLAGDLPDEAWTMEELKHYLQHAYKINPQAEFSQTPAGGIKGMPLDLMILLTKGR